MTPINADDRQFSGRKYVVNSVRVGGVRCLSEIITT